MPGGERRTPRDASSNTGRGAALPAPRHCSVRLAPAVPGLKPNPLEGTEILGGERREVVEVFMASNFATAGPTASSLSDPLRTRRGTKALIGWEIPQPGTTLKACGTRYMVQKG
jgi:hypothetical protein